MVLEAIIAHKTETSAHVIYGMGQEVLFWKIEKSQ